MLIEAMLFELMTAFIEICLIRVGVAFYQLVVYKISYWINERGRQRIENIRLLRKFIYIW